MILTARPGFSGGDEQVGLAAEEGGDLEDVDGLGRDLALAGLMDVGEDRKAGLASQAAEDAGPFDETGAAKTFYAGAVCLVVAGLEDEGDGEVGGNALQGVGQGADVMFALDDAGAGYQEEPARANLHWSEFKRSLGFKFVSVDLEGFRSGSLNAVLSVESLTMTR